MSSKSTNILAVAADALVVIELALLVHASQVNTLSSVLLSSLSYFSLIGLFAVRRGWL